MRAVGTIAQNLVRNGQKDLRMHSMNLMSMETKSSPNNETAGFEKLISNDPRLVTLPDTPAPVICEYCGAERYTDGFILSNKIFWHPNGAKPCACPDGQAEYELRQKKQMALEKAEEEAKANQEMRKRVSRIIGESGMGERFLQRTFESFVTDTQERVKIAAAAKRYATNFKSYLPKHGEPLPGRNGLFITGTIGTGKTHIAAAIANHLLNSGTAVVCMTERNLFGEIRRTYSRGRENGVSESEVRGIYETVPLLIIDDLGKEKSSEWTLATLYAIIDGRYDSAMPVIITTNYGTQDLIMRLTPAGKDEITAKAIVDRLNEMCKAVVMDWESWRSN